VSRWWLVETADDLTVHHQTRTGAWLSILQVSGVLSLSDLEVVSEETLKAITLPAELALPTPKRARKAS